MLGKYFSMDRVEARARCIFKLCFHVVGVWRPHSITWKRDTSGTSMWQANAYTHWQEKLRERLMGNGLGFGLATCCTAWCCLDFSCSCCCFCRLAFNCKSNSSSWSSNSRSCCFRSPEWQHEGHSQCKHETLFCQVTVWNKRCRVPNLSSQRVPVQRPQISCESTCLCLGDVGWSQCCQDLSQHPNLQCHDQWHKHQHSSLEMCN